MKKIIAFVMAAVAMNCFAAPVGAWKNIGRGEWHEDLFPVVFDGVAHASWAVDVEQSETDPKWYRVAPYAVESVVTEKSGKTDGVWLYINTTDPDKVYVEDFKVFDAYEFEQLVPECGYKAHDRYASLKNSIISWPRISMRVSVPSEGLYDCNTCLNTEMALVLPDEEVTGIWRPLGEADFVDGIVSAMIDKKPSTVRVTVEERNDKPGYYRLVGAWSQWGGEETFEIDASDPDFVRCPFQETGVKFGEEYGFGKIVSVGETYVHDRGMTKEQFIENNPERVIVKKDNVIRIPANAIVFNFPTYDWLKFYESETPAESVVNIPDPAGIAGIGADDSVDAPVYYNLQGVRVDNPSTGVYIVRKGAKVGKVLIR